MKKFIIVIVCLILILLTGCVQDSKHSHNSCLECGKCIVEDCNGLEEEKCQGHQVGHQHIECKVCGKCVDVECTGKENERCKKSYLVTLESHQYISFTDSLEDLQFYIIQDYSQYIEFIQKNEIKEIYYDEENNIYYNEDIANQFTEEFFIDSALVLISYFTATSLDDLTVIKSYELENGILNIKFGVPKTDLIPKNNCYLVYMFKCNKHTLVDLITVEYKFGVKD